MTFPKVYSISDLVFRSSVWLELIAFYPGIGAIGEMDSKEGVLKSVVFNSNVLWVEDFYCREIIDAGDAGIFEF
jgi:hypothetical protein